MTNSNLIEEIGVVAGRIWNCLSENGGMSVAKLVKHLELPRDQVLQGVGWLAREDKVIIEKKTRGHTIRLNESNR
ncbi:MAG: winged helix-turn-helix domain-containing protein [Planctomycetota bacterium]